MKTVFVTLLCCSILITLVGGLIYPHKRVFENEDNTIAYKFIKNEIINLERLLLISIFVPLSIIFLVFRNSNFDKLIEAEVYLSFITSLAVCIAITETIKVIVGELRPDFLDRCSPIKNICTGDFNLIKEGRKSFPSGHSSISSCSTTFLLIIINNETVKKNCSMLKQKINRMIISVILLLIPIIIGISRIYDHRHHVRDVLVGWSLGLICPILILKINRRIKF